MNEEPEGFNNEWARYQIILPADEFDEDDELDARIEKAERRKRGHISRGGFFGTQ